MQSRKLHAVASFALFMLIAMTYASLSHTVVDIQRVALWSGAGVLCYVLLSGLFGFDPYRSRIAAVAPALVQYMDRWELRLGQATLSMLGCIVAAAGLFDPENFVAAVVSGILAAWTYFVVRLYAGGYRTAVPVSQR